MLKTPNKTLKLPQMPARTVFEAIAKDYYCVPKWCRMHPFDHFDGMGGCWSVSNGLVLAQGETRCLCCDYHKDNVKTPEEPEKA